MAEKSGDAKTEAPEVSKLRVFLSYSRKDSEFVAKLSDALTAKGYLADYDKSAHDPHNVDSGISAEDDWWKRLKELIAAADVMVVIVSPDSAASRVCGQEIAHAQALGKRLIPLLWRQIDFATAPPSLAALNVKIDFSAQSQHSFDHSLEQLGVALDNDVVWLREQTRLLAAATDWQTDARRQEGLLTGAEIGEAEAWSARRPPAIPPIPELVLDFLACSRRAQSEREAGERRRIRQQRTLQQWVGALLAVAVVVTALGGWFVLRAQRDLSRKSSAALAIAAASEFDAGRHDRAMRIALVAARNTWLAPAAPEAAFELGKAAGAMRLLAHWPNMPAPGCIGASQDGSLIVAGAGPFAGFSGTPQEAAPARLLYLNASGEWAEHRLSNKDLCPVLDETRSEILLARAKKASILVRRSDAWVSSELSSELFSGVSGMRALPSGRLVGNSGGTLSVIERDGANKWHAQILPPVEDATLKTAVLGLLAAADDGATLVAGLGNRLRLWSRQPDGEWIASELTFKRSPDAPAPTTTPPRPGASLAEFGAGGLDAEFDDLDFRSSDEFWGERTIRLSADGHRLLIVAPREGLHELWEQQPHGGWKRVARLPAPDMRATNQGYWLSPTGTLILARLSDGLEMWSVDAEGKLAIRTVQDTRDVDGEPAFSSDGRRVAIPTKHGFEVWRTDDLNAPPRKMPTGNESRGALTRDGEILVTSAQGMNDVGLSFWSLKEKTTSFQGASAGRAGFIPDGRLLALFPDQTARIWKKGADRKWRTEGSPSRGEIFPKDTPLIGSILIHDTDGLSVVDVSTDLRWRQTTVLEDMDKKRAVMSANGMLVLTVDMTDTAAVLVRDGSSKPAFKESARLRLDGHKILSAGVSSDGDRIVTISSDLTNVKGVFKMVGGLLAGTDVTLWTQASDGNWRPRQLRDELPAGTERIAMAPDGRTIAAVGDDGLFIWTEGENAAWREERVQSPLANGDSVWVLRGGDAIMTANFGETTFWTRRYDGKWISAPVDIGGPPARDYFPAPDATSVLNLPSDAPPSVRDTSWFVSPTAAVSAKVFNELTNWSCEDQLAGDGMANLKILSADDVQAVPILRGLSGSDVCNWRPAWYDQLADTLLGWIN